MRVAIGGWFSGSTVGSGQYTDALLSALRTTSRDDDQYVLIEPRSRRGAVGKVVFEQVHFPRLSRGYDVAHVPYWAAPAVPLAPTVVTIHDLIPLLVPEYRPDARVRAYFSLVSRASRRASALMVDSEHTAADVATHLGIPRSRVSVVPLGVGPAFRPEATLGIGDRASERDELHALFGLPPRYGLYLGGFDPRKNLATLMKAWRAVHAASGLPLVVAGQPRTRSMLPWESPDETASRVGLSREAFLAIGAVPQRKLPALYRGASVFAYPSRFEGFGLPPLEAMACGVPVVASNATSLPEVVGDAGILVPPDADERWSEELMRVLEDDGLADRLRTAGQQRASRFTWTETARLARAVYNSVLA